MVAPAPRDVEIRAMTYTASSPVGGTTAALAAAPVDADGSNGCEPTDFATDTFSGKVALIKRGGCTFAAKQANAARRGTPSARSSTTTPRASSAAPSARPARARSRRAASRWRTASSSPPTWRPARSRSPRHPPAPGAADHAQRHRRDPAGQRRQHGDARLPPGLGDRGPRHQRQRLRLGRPAGRGAEVRQAEAQDHQQGAVRLVGCGGERPPRVRALRREPRRPRPQGDQALPQLRHDRLAELRPVRVRRQRLRPGRRPGGTGGLRPAGAGHHRVHGREGPAARGHGLHGPLRLRAVHRRGHPWPAAPSPARRASRPRRRP